MNTHAHYDALDTIQLNESLLASPHWTSQIIYEDVACRMQGQPFREALMSLCSIATKCNGPLEAAHPRREDDRYDLVRCGAAGQPSLDLSDQLRACM